MSERFWTISVRVFAMLGALSILVVLTMGKSTDILLVILLPCWLFSLGVLLLMIWDITFDVPKETESRQITLLAILFLALVVRLAAAQKPGYGFDVSVNKGWARSAVSLGLAHSYTEQLDGNQLPSYPPLSITLFWLTGQFYKHAISPDFDAKLPAYDIVIRFPALVADLAACLILALIAGRLGWRRGRILLPLAYALHPVVLYDTGVWGQTDGIYTLWMLLSLSDMSHRRWGRTGLWTACAILTKPQALPLLPVVLFVSLRHWRSASLFLGSVLLATLFILLPYLTGGVLKPIIAVYTQTMGGYFNGVTNGAYNFWTALYGTAGREDTGLVFGLISFRTVGLSLFVLAGFAVLLRMRRMLFSALPSQRMVGTLFTGALLASAFFLFTTEMHERYHFAYVLLALPIAALSPAGAFLYIGTSIMILLNIVAMLPFGHLDSALFREWAALPMFIGTAQVFLFALSIGWGPKLVAGASHILDIDEGRRSRQKLNGVSSS